MSGGVYILRSGNENLFKVGRADDLDQRLRNLSTGNPHPLTVFDRIETAFAAECETYLHHCLRTKRSRRSAATEFFEIDPAEIAALIAEARHHADHVLPRHREAERLAQEECEDDRVIEPGPAEWDTYERLLKAREAEDLARYERERLEDELKLVMGRAGGLAGIATWKTLIVHRFDAEAFKAAQPELYAQFLRESRTRTFRIS